MISKSIENTMIILKFIILQSDLCFFKPVYSLGEDCEVYLLILPLITGHSETVTVPDKPIHVLVISDNN